VSPNQQAVQEWCDRHPRGFVQAVADHMTKHTVRELPFLAARTAIRFYLRDTE
jgi:hypothetical protein